jgi:site-specific DNA recombinase
MNQDQTKIKYFLYARKSSESEDRQVQSIDDQVNWFKKMALDKGFEILEILTEAKSAKKPNNRPVFDGMMERIENGEAQGILSWQLNRLSRNPIDSGKIQWLLQKGVIKSIQTVDREYRPEDNTLLFSLESGVANQFLLDLSKNVKRGMKSKLDKGWRPGAAPAGYINELAEHTIQKDPERFILIRKAWDLMLTGNYTIVQILDKLNNEWGFRSLKRKRSGGKPLAISGLYAIFTNLFYAGIISHSGQQYPGKQEPMVTLEEYDHVQILLGRKARPRPQSHEFAFTGIMRCGDCGCLITAETKTKLIKSEGKLKYFVYYHCTHRKIITPCFQKKVLPVAELETQIEKEVRSLTIMPEFQQWALESLSDKNDREIDDRTKVYESQHKALTEAQANLDSLTKMRYRELIDDEMFLKEKTELVNKITQLKGQLRETEGRAERWLELTERFFNFAFYAHKAFLTGDLQTKRDILAALGYNYILKGQKLTISYHNYFDKVIKRYPALEEEYLRLELNKHPINTKQKDALASIRTRWLGCQDSNLGMSGSEPLALPLGYTPIINSKY